LQKSHLQTEDSCAFGQSVRQASALVCEGARATSKKRQKEDIRQRHRTDINGQGSSQQSKTVVQYTVVQ